MPLPPFDHNVNLPPAKGFAVLLAVLVTGTVGVAIALYLLTSGIASYQLIDTVEKNNQAKALVNTCGETALGTLAACTSTLGTASVTLGGQTCTYTITPGTGEERTITAQGTAGEAVRKLTIMVNKLSPSVTVSSWLETP